VCADAEVGIDVQREVGALVAAVALRLVHEYGHSADLRFAHRSLLAALVAIVRGVTAEHRALEGGDRHGDAIDVDLLGAERGFEERAITCDRLDPADRSRVRHAHFDRVRDRALRLILERHGTAVPELGLRERAIDHAWSAAPALLSIDAGRDGSAVGES